MATVLKAAAQPGSPIAPLDTTNSALQERAREEAAAIVDAARSEAAAIRAQARDEGRAQGVAEAVAALGAAAAVRDRLLASSERDVVALGLAVARRLVAAAALDHAVAVESARLAVARARERVQLTVRVNPADAAAVRAAEPPLALLAPCCSAFAVLDDCSVPRGGAVVETEAGSIDARLESRLEAVECAVTEAVS